MEETFRQLGGLLLGSIPTIVLFVILFAAYNALVHKPLEKVLAQRRVKTEGAIEVARAEIAAAEARTTEYETRLREARIGIYKAQETRRQQAMQSRAAAVAEVKARVDLQVKQQKEALAQDVAQAKASLQVDAERLSADIIESILRQVGMAQHPMGGGR